MKLETTLRVKQGIQVHYKAKIKQQHNQQTHQKSPQVSEGISLNEFQSGTHSQFCTN